MRAEGQRLPCGVVAYLLLHGELVHELGGPGHAAASTHRAEGSCTHVSHDKHIRYRRSSRHTTFLNPCEIAVWAWCDALT